MTSDSAEPAPVGTGAVVPPSASSDPSHADLVSALRADIEAARRTAADAEASRIRLGEFLRMAVHDLRGPLASCIGFAELLSARDLDDAMRSECVSSILRAGRDIEKMAADLADFARVETGALKVARRPLDFRELVADVLDGLETRMGGRSADLDSFIDDSVPEQISTDGARLSQVLTILLEHAVGQEDSPSGRDRMAADFRCRDGQLLISVTDPGPLPDAKALARVFPPESSAADPSGLRPGEPAFRLYLARGILGALGGSLTVHPPPAGATGAVFIATIDIGLPA